MTILYLLIFTFLSSLGLVIFPIFRRLVSTIIYYTHLSCFLGLTFGFLTEVFARFIVNHLVGGHQTG